jgi:hypothetical protein
MIWANCGADLKNPVNFVFAGFFIVHFKDQIPKKIRTITPFRLKKGYICTFFNHGFIRYDICGAPFINLIPRLYQRRVC